MEFGSCRIIQDLTPRFLFGVISPKLALQGAWAVLGAVVVGCEGAVALGLAALKPLGLGLVLVYRWAAHSSPLLQPTWGARRCFNPSAAPA